jgi:hypothetical protein
MPVWALAVRQAVEDWETGGGLGRRFVRARTTTVRPEARPGPGPGSAPGRGTPSAGPEPGVLLGGEVKTSLNHLSWPS